MSRAMARDEVAAGDGALRTWRTFGADGEGEVVEELAVAGDGLGSDAGGARFDVGGLEGRDVGGAGLDEGALRAAKCISVRPVRQKRRAILQVPGQVRVATMSRRLKVRRE